MRTESFKALLVEERQDENTGKARYEASVVKRSTEDLPDGDVLIRVRYSSLNYKDAMSARGNKGVTRHFPHTPGIDAAGEVVSDGGGFSAGEEVVVIGYDLGMETDGGFGQYARVPSDWVVRRPDGLSLREAMIIGTAGFTAALCVEKLLLNGVTPEQGPVLVSGATGGVGSYAVALLSRLGFRVTALTGKADAADYLSGLGADAVLDRSELSEEASRPMLKEQWAGAVDTVGGEILSNTLKSLQYGGSVACCGLVASPVFSASVLPFILRGVNLLGVDSVNLPLEKKAAVWERLAGEWKIDDLEQMATEIGFSELPGSLDTVFRGGARGRYLLNLDRD
ncbi:MAG: YhdH/YhfP family quinone oxidoreductase [Pseudohongiellaceae bacterium]